MIEKEEKVNEQKKTALTLICTEKCMPTVDLRNFLSINSFQYT